MKNNYLKKQNNANLKLGILFIGLLAFVACNKNKDYVGGNAAGVEVSGEDKSITKALTIAIIRLSESASETEVMFLQSAQIYAVSDAEILKKLNDAFTNQKSVSVVFDNTETTILKVNDLDVNEALELNKRKNIVSSEVGKAIKFSDINFETINESERLGIINTTSPGLTNVVPDLATANLMFNEMARRCCVAGVPYNVNCISFKYARDGCYARAHKMCNILNTKYNYATHKIFSFANAGSDRLSVKGNKWGGCCITWWYHVAPLLNVKTPAGTLAYVFDPSMFNQPVLLSEWLHAQENPACSTTAHVSMINIQPTASYSPAGSSGLTFNTDVSYSNTNSTLYSYHNLTTCP